jgi:hypothetical protein
MSVEGPALRAILCQIIRPDRSRRRSITLIVVTLAVLVGGALVLGTRVIRRLDCCPKEDVARATVKKYADEAYPSWSADHPGQMCPRRLEQLNEYMNNKDTKDPWGNTYRMFCGVDMALGVKPFAVTSAGEDGVEGTADDIKSWE